MRRRYTLFDAGCVLLALAGGAALTSRAEGPDDRADVQVRRGGVRSAHQVRGGLAVGAQDAEGQSVLTAVRAARDALPAALRVPVVVQLEPLALTFAGSSGPVQAYPLAGTLAVHGVAAVVHSSIWLHELVHLAAAGERPRSALGARLMTAVDEGAADFVAAAFGGSAVVGSRAAGEERDLSAPPFVGDSEWAFLAVSSAPFDAHRLGWALAASLYREGESGRPTLATDVVRALALRAPFVASDTPGEVLAEWISRCPERSRSTLERAVRRWIPQELFPSEGSS